MGDLALCGTHGKCLINGGITVTPWGLRGSLQSGILIPAGEGDVGGSSAEAGNELG